MKKILITHEIPEPAEQNLSRHFLVTVHRGDALTKQDLIQMVQRYDAILSMVSDPLDAEVLSHATTLKAISNYGIGLNNIDVEFAKSRGIHVYNLPDIVTNSTADLTMALLLSFARKIPQAAQFVQEDLWKKVDPMLFLGEELNQKKLGIVGFGRIGKAVAKRAIGFGMKVLFYQRYQVELEPVLREHFQQVSWEELLGGSDFLSLHMPLTPATHKLINAQAFGQMKKHPVLINTARGAIVDTDALVHALQLGQVRGAALDVTDPEPISASHPLCKAPNCLIIPHLGTATVDARQSMSKKAAQHLIDHFEPMNMR